MKFHKGLSGILFYLLSFICIILFIGVGYTTYRYLVSRADGTEKTIAEDTTAIMLLIEFENTDGLENFVYQMNERNIPGVLMVNPEFAQEYSENLLQIQEYDIEITGSYSGEPLWDVSYEEQYEIMKDTKEQIEAVTGESMRAFGSRYFAYDENTIKAAEELGIDYIFARGTTGAKATIYKPDEYDVKIFSVSNVSSEKWGTGSLCDYSYWAREGTPEEFEKELLDALKYSKVSPVSHSYLGGVKKYWNEAYLSLWDHDDITWVNLDEFGEIDISLPMEDIPDNREVQYTTPKPAVPFDEEEDVDNPCSVVEYSSEDTTEINKENYVGNKIVMYHNGLGSMCLDALDYLETVDYTVEEHLVGEDNFTSSLQDLQEVYQVSEGVSVNFGFYPMIFIQDRAFSGFNEDIQDEIEELI
jgi:hypothetical protein